MKKVFAWLLVAVMVVAGIGFAACGGDGGGTTTDGGGATATDGGGTTDNGGTTEDDGGNGGGGDDGEDLSDILGQGAGLDSVHYVMETTAPGTPTVTMEMWVEGNKMRMEMDEQGQNVVYLANYNTNTAYMYMPDQNMAIQVDISQVSQPDYEGVQDIPDYDYAVIGTETFDGKVCLVVEYSAAGATVKSWIWKEHGFPVKTETTTSQGTVVTIFRNISFDDINDSLFELPAGVQIMSY